MAKALLLEFPGVTRAEYDAVNEALGVNPATGAGDWPEGLISHTGGATDAGAFAVFEVWESMELQDAFMSTRLGAALAGAGVGEPSRVDWFDVWGIHISA